MEMTDGEVHQDSRDLLEKLQEMHLSAFTWSLHCCAGQRAEAEDVLQTVYLKLLTGAARFHGRSAFKTWLFAVIRSTARDTHRSIGRRLRLLSTWLASRAVAHEATAPALAYEHERRESVTRLLSGLSTRQRELLQLVFYHDLTVEQAADVLGISVGSARVHYERGKDNLRRRLAPFEEQYDRARRGTNQAAV
jgi:RNA polymerase sigma-70 factor (ECF subfamily)